MTYQEFIRKYGDKYTWWDVVTGGRLADWCTMETECVRKLLADMAAIKQHENAADAELAKVTRDFGDSE